MWSRDPSCKGPISVPYIHRSLAIMPTAFPLAFLCDTWREGDFKGGGCLQWYNRVLLFWQDKFDVEKPECARVASESSSTTPLIGFALQILDELSQSTQWNSSIISKNSKDSLLPPVFLLLSTIALYLSNSALHFSFIWAKLLELPMPAALQCSVKVFFLYYFWSCSDFDGGLCMQR